MALAKSLRELNPHWSTGQIDPRIAEFRTRRFFSLLYPLASATAPRRAVVLLGPRRVGKTVLLQQLIGQLLREGRPPADIVYFAVDLPVFVGLSLQELLDIYREIHGKGHLRDCTVIFDEIQYLPNWHGHLKALVDFNAHTRFVASGSAAAALRLKSLESGAGRFTEFRLPPVTFYEYIDLLDLIAEVWSPLRIARLNEEFVKYINSGGYPETLFDAEVRSNPGRFIKDDIVDKVLLRDLPSLYGIDDIPDLNRFFSSLAYQTGGEVALEWLSQAAGVSKPTIKKYIEYLESAFLIKTLNRVDISGKSFKRVNFFKVYLTNPSMYTALFGPVSDSHEAMGALAETAIVSQFLHSEDALRRMHYARWSKGEGEVDLVFLDRRYRPRSAIEIKWSDRHVHQLSELANLVSFCLKIGLPRALVSTRSIWSENRKIGPVSLDFVETALLCYAIGRAIIEQEEQDIPEYVRAIGACDLFSFHETSD
jgi:predicted AAA+ superfamily ATPase